MSNSDLIDTQVKPWTTINPYSITFNGSLYPAGVIQFYRKKVTTNLIFNSTTVGPINVYYTRYGNICYFSVNFPQAINISGSPAFLEIEAPISSDFISAGSKSWSQLFIMRNNGGTACYLCNAVCQTIADGGTNNIKIYPLAGGTFSNVLTDILPQTINYTI